MMGSQNYVIDPVALVESTSIINRFINRRFQKGSNSPTCLE